jgi:Uma2 family endonuclease
MSIATKQEWTTAELLAFPDDGMDRYLIRGQLREKPMTKRNRWHSRIEARLAQLLGMWLDQQPEPRGEVYAGEAGCILRRNPDTTVGIDLAYFSAEVIAGQAGGTTMIEGVPILAGEILSPSDTQEEIDEKLDEYRTSGVRQVWVVDAHDETVLVYRQGAAPELVNVTQELAGEPDLPGFRVRVADIFSRGARP